MKPIWHEIITAILLILLVSSACTLLRLYLGCPIWSMAIVSFLSGALIGKMRLHKMFARK